MVDALHSQHSKFQSSHYILSLCELPNSTPPAFPTQHIPWANRCIAGMNLWAGFQAWLGPLPVEVSSCSIGAEVPSPAAIRVHVGHNVEDCLLQCMPSKGTVAIQQPFQEPCRFGGIEAALRWLVTCFLCRRRWFVCIYAANACRCSA